MIKYEATGYSWDGYIRTVEVVKETAKMVEVVQAYYGAMERTGGTIRRKKGAYFDSWAQARDYLVAKAEFRLKTANQTVDLCRSKLATVKALKEAE